MGAALLFFTFLTGVSSFLILHQLGNQMKRQIEMDQFTGSIVIQLRASILTLEESEKRLRVAKAAMIAGCAYLPSCPAFTKAYELQRKVESVIQGIAKQNWNAQKLKWTMHEPFSCIKSDFPGIEETRSEQAGRIKLERGHLVSESSLFIIPGSKTWKIAWSK